jgi:hypothetical protein
MNLFSAACPLCLPNCLSGLHQPLEKEWRKPRCLGAPSLGLFARSSKQSIDCRFGVQLLELEVAGSSPARLPYHFGGGSSVAERDNL